MRKEVRMVVLAEEDALTADIVQRVSELAGHKEELVR